MSRPPRRGSEGIQNHGVIVISGSSNSHPFHPWRRGSPQSPAHIPGMGNSNKYNECLQNASEVPDHGSARTSELSQSP